MARVPDENFRRLWKQVMVLIWEDANSRHHKLSTEAIRFLTTPSEDLELICDWAEVKYEDVLSVSQTKFGGRL
jgi:hypothetical protein